MYLSLKFLESMLQNQKMLLRYKTLDKCFRSDSQQYTLSDLVKICSEVLKENVSERSIQADIQFLRDTVSGYGAPIVIVNRKFYQYSDKTYTLLKAKTPPKLQEQFAQSIALIKEFSELADFEEQNSNLIRKTKSKHIHYVKLKEEMERKGFSIHSKFYTEKQIQRIEGLIRREKITESTDLIQQAPKIIETLLHNQLLKILKKINPRFFLVDAQYHSSQKIKEFEQTLKFPMKERKIPKNLTLWGYPTEDKITPPDYSALHDETLMVQVFLKNITQKTGAVQIIQGSHQRELSPLEVLLIGNNTYPTACEVDKGGIVLMKPLAVKKVAMSESPKLKQSIVLWFSSYKLPIHYVWNHEIAL